MSMTAEQQVVVDEVVRSIEERDNCRDHRRRWENAFFQERLFRALYGAFVTATLVFVVGAFVVYFLLDQDLAAAAMTFIGGVVTGVVAAFFQRVQKEADEREDLIWDAYVKACPTDSAAAKEELMVK